MSNSWQSFRDSRAFDLLAAVPLIAWYGLTVIGLVIKNYRQIESLTAGTDWQVYLEMAGQFATVLFLGVQIVLFLIRRMPLAKAKGLAPRIAGFVGANLVFAFLALPRATLSPPLRIVSTSIVFLATIACILVATNLGRAFSVLPQARQFVQHGPYRFVRHPLYLAEQIGTWGLMLQFVQPWALLIACASLAAQFPRMHFEEHVLGETFPQYKPYAARTKRLVPGLY